MPVGGGSSLRDVEAVGAGGSADDFLSGDCTGLSGTGASGSGVAATGAGGTAGLISAGFADTESMEVICAEPLSDLAWEAAIAAAPAASATPGMSFRMIVSPPGLSVIVGAVRAGFSSAAGTGGTLGGTTGGGTTGAVFFIGAEEGALGADESGGAPPIGADFFCGGGRGGALGVEGTGGALPTGADFFCGGVKGAPPTGAERFCGGGKGGALRVAAAGGTKTGADFFCGGGTGGADGVDAVGVVGAGGALAVSEPVFGRGGGKGGARKPVLARVGAA